MEEGTVVVTGSERGLKEGRRVRVHHGKEIRLESGDTVREGQASSCTWASASETKTTHQRMKSGARNGQTSSDNGARREGEGGKKNRKEEKKKTAGATASHGL